jgi:magnesium transporter
MARAKRKEEATMVKHFSIVEGKITERSGGEGPILLYVNPDAAEVQYLRRECLLDEHTLQSSLDPNELARMEFEPDHCALIVKRPKRYCAMDDFYFKVESIGLFLFADKLILLMNEDLPIFEGRPFTLVADFRELVLKIIYRSIIHFEEHLKVINACSEELERGINTSVSNRQLLSMFTLEKSLVFYIDAISSNGRVIDRIKANAAKLGLSSLNVELLDDLAIENGQCLGMAQNYSQVLSGLMDARASIISNNLNITMKNLNAIVIAIAIPSFFAGVGGMSEFSNMIGFHHWKLGYPFFIFAMALLGVSTFLLLKLTERYWSK